MRWEDIPQVVDDWDAKSADAAAHLLKCAAALITGCHAGYYFNPVTSETAIYAPDADDGDAVRVKTAAARAVGHAHVRPLFLSYQELADPDSSWVKVAHSPALRRAGELLNFFPGQYPGGIPNAPSPVAAMLTSGLLGAGLGWGGGKLLGRLLPDKFGKNLGRTGLILGGLAGAAPGAAWSGTNKMIGYGFNDPTLLNTAAGAEPDNYPRFSDGSNSAVPADGEGDSLVDKAKKMVGKTILPKKFAADLSDVPLGDMYAAAAEKAAETFGTPDRVDPSSTDVNINHLGHTLWQGGASPSLAGSTMGAIYAAQQFPDPRARPGFVTGNQLGTLAANAAGDYANGVLVGAALNAVVGSPLSSSQYGAANAALGVIGAVVPKLFGR